MTDDATDDGRISRRTVLRTGGAAAGALSLGAAGSGSAAAFISGGTAPPDDPGNGGGEDDDRGSDEKRGGRAQADGDLNRNEPFVLSDTPTGVSMNASCMAEESAQQGYLEYDIEYCDSDDEATIYVIPQEAELAQDEVYEIRAIQECRASDNELIAFGPSQRDEC